jgi:hypothetical protein
LKLEIDLYTLKWSLHAHQTVVEERRDAHRDSLSKWRGIALVAAGKNILPCALLHVRRGFVPTVALVAAGKNILPCALLHVRRGFAATVALVAAGRILCPVHCCCSSAEASL